jgi:hypothetical protein
VSQKPMPTEILAQAMINSAQLKTEKISFIKLNKIFETAKV